MSCERVAKRQETIQQTLHMFFSSRSSIDTSADLKLPPTDISAAFISRSSADSSSVLAVVQLHSEVAGEGGKS